MSQPKQVKACLFDMDGLLLNTEDIYTLSLNEILAEYGKGPLTWDVKIHLQGLPGEEAGRKVIESYNLPITYKEYNKLNLEIQGKMWGKCSFLPGALDLIKYLKSKNIPIALCTSSAKIKYDLKTQHLCGIFQLFDTIITGDDPRIPKGMGKPFPNIWQLGLKELNKKFNATIQPQECLLFEDGIPGVKSGLAFGATVIWVPHPGAYEYLGDTETLLSNKGELLKSLELLNKPKYGL